MDKTMRVILSLGIAILFPLVLYFTVVTLIPSDKSIKYPDYPSCSESRYDSASRTYREDDICKRQYDEYDRKIDNYNEEQKKEDKLAVHRAQVALVIAVLTSVGIFFIRDVKEVAAGLVGGSAFAVIGAISVMLSGQHDDDALKTINSLLSIAAFLALSGIMYAIDKTVPESKHGPHGPTNPDLPQYPSEDLHSVRQPEPPPAHALPNEPRHRENSNQDFQNNQTQPENHDASHNHPPHSRHDQQ